MRRERCAFEITFIAVTEITENWFTTTRESNHFGCVTTMQGTKVSRSLKKTCAAPREAFSKYGLVKYRGGRRERELMLKLCLPELERLLQF